jgi:putative transcriptional regulator
MPKFQGQLLLASARLMDPNFVRTVVLMVQHDDKGSLGLVVNRALEITIQQACEQALDTQCAVEGMLHQGGPCEGPLMVVHEYEDKADLAVSPGIFFTTEKEKIEWLLQNNERSIKFFVGYAGWGPGQLEAEMETGSWVTAAANDQRVFDEDERQWMRLMTEVTLGQAIDPRMIPDDPSLN